ncbi:ankyrin repeat protein [Acanthamoeba polyphaga moumouvirus]|uniref:Ankyrin repeat protein n=1 Tax=Acanthamoeba polyphaga moumouvirus TaxID=1269028 RepID=L7RE25_9VIRU|nr:ankyrin repeat protein [Acanthamoeba polyphaga moumouvirus]AGC02373.1 ankyrin repeat protein [Acanthamoeba polyphaga moumouvirus]
MSYFMICDKEDYRKYDNCIDQHFHEILFNCDENEHTDKVSAKTLFEQKHEDKKYWFNIFEAKNIFKFIHLGKYVCKVYLPQENPNFQIFTEDEIKYFCNMIVIEEFGNLDDKETIEYLLSEGADINIFTEYDLNFLCQNDNLFAIKHLVSRGLNLKNKKMAFRTSIQCGHYDIVKYFVESGVDIRENNDYAIKLAFECGNSQIINYLIEKNNFIIPAA